MTNLRPTFKRNKDLSFVNLKKYNWKMLNSFELNFRLRMTTNSRANGGNMMSNNSILAIELKQFEFKANGNISIPQTKLVRSRRICFGALFCKQLIDTFEYETVKFVASFIQLLALTNQESQTQWTKVSRATEH